MRLWWYWWNRIGLLEKVQTIFLWGQCPQIQSSMWQAEKVINENVFLFIFQIPIQLKLCFNYLPIGMQRQEAYWWQFYSAPWPHPWQMKKLWLIPQFQMRMIQFLWLCSMPIDRDLQKYYAPQLGLAYYNVYHWDTSLLLLSQLLETQRMWSKYLSNSFLVFSQERRESYYDEVLFGSFCTTLYLLPRVPSNSLVYEPYTYSTLRNWVFFNFSYKLLIDYVGI